MPNNIANVTVPAPVIQLNNKQYLTPEGQYNPQTLNVPCGINALVDDIQWWMTPVKDFGIISILQAIPQEVGGENSDQPTPDSILVTRIRDKYRPDWTWWIVCTLAEYYAACEACCGDSPVSIPNPTLPIIVPCQNLCDSQNDAGDFFVTFAAPILGAGQHYVVSGQFDNEDVLEGISAVNIGAVITVLNAMFNNPGSPAVTILWTLNGTTIIGTVQGGVGEDSSVCLLIQAVT